MDGTRETGTILDRILKQTAADAELREQRTSASELERVAGTLPAPPSLREAVLRPGMSVIAEIKRASPSKGRFPVEFDSTLLATAYVDGGADAISVLTDEPFFHGSLADLDAVVDVAKRVNPPVPVLRKDFIVGRYQMLEARARGGSAILLIVAALEQGLLEELMALAGDAGATLIGINNRDLHTFDVDLNVSERLAQLGPAGAALVGESGILDGADAARMAAAGMDAILVGEALVVAEDKAEAIQKFKLGADHARSTV